jgi:hypothetical protein
MVHTYFNEEVDVEEVEGHDVVTQSAYGSNGELFIAKSRASADSSSPPSEIGVIGFVSQGMDDEVAYKFDINWYTADQLPSIFVNTTAESLSTVHHARIMVISPITPETSTSNEEV